jgi:hypothetical protein
MTTRSTNRSNAADSVSRGENGVVDEQRGVILYGDGVDAVAAALRELDPRYVGGVAPGPGQVRVLRYPDAAQADAARMAAPDVAWLVVELYRPGDALEHAHDPLLVLNAAKVEPTTAARAIDQHDLLVWYEIINPIRVVTVDGGPAADDYRNLKVIMPDGHRMVAHAVRQGGTAPPCLPRNAERVLPSHDLWALTGLLGTDVCQTCTLRHH